jgi:hypothetical protein
VKECTCPPEHSVTKLGHCRTCDAYEVARRAERIELPAEDLIALKLATIDGDMTMAHSCGGPCPTSRGRRGGRHDFDWATYADDECSYGVCDCGLSAIDFDMMSMP